MSDTHWDHLGFEPSVSITDKHRGDVHEPDLWYLLQQSLSDAIDEGQDVAAEFEAVTLRDINSMGD